MLLEERWRLHCSGMEIYCILSRYSIFPSSLYQSQGLRQVVHSSVGVLVVQGADGKLAEFLSPGHLVHTQPRGWTTSSSSHRH